VQLNTLFGRAAPRCSLRIGTAYPVSLGSERFFCTKQRQSSPLTDWNISCTHIVEYWASLHVTRPPRRPNRTCSSPLLQQGCNTPSTPGHLQCPLQTRLPPTSVHFSVTIFTHMRMHAVSWCLASGSSQPLPYHCCRSTNPACVTFPCPVVICAGLKHLSVSAQFFSEHSTTSVPQLSIAPPAPHQQPCHTRRSCCCSLPRLQPRLRHGSRVCCPQLQSMYGTLSQGHMRLPRTSSRSSMQPARLPQALAALQDSRPRVQQTTGCLAA
jgi:hypothetical protein